MFKFEVNDPNIIININTIIINNAIQATLFLITPDFLLRVIPDFDATPIIQSAIVMVIFMRKMLRIKKAVDKITGDAKLVTVEP